MWLANSINAVLLVFIVLAVGVFLNAKGWFDETGENYLSKLLMYVVQPCIIFSGVFGSFKLELLKEIGPDIVYAFILPIVVFLAAFFLGKLIRLPQGQFGIAVSDFAFANIASIGMPLCKMIYGEECLVYITSFYVTSLVMYYLLAETLIAMDMEAGVDKKATIIKQLKSPITISVFLGIIGGLSGITLPVFITNSISTLGNCALAMILIMSGGIIYRAGWKSLVRWNKARLFGTIGKMILSPAITLCICLLLRMPAIAAASYTTIAGMPSVTQPIITAKFYGADATTATEIYYSTTLLVLVMIPAFIAIVSALYGL